MGNSASLGFDSKIEFLEYGSYIKNVHVKDRLYKGSTVPLGRGAVDFDAVFRGLSDLKYQGNYILQTARAKNGDHQGILENYRKIVVSYLNKY